MTELAPQTSDLCPPWCTGTHDDDAHGRVTHRGASVIVPVIEREHPLAATDSTPYGSDLVVGLERRDDETWIWMGPSEDAARGMILSVESARRLQRALASVLATGCRPE